MGVVAGFPAFTRLPGRHTNTYSHTFAADVANLVKTMERHPDLRFKESAAIACGRGMINFRKLFSHGLVEFRAFAGTTNLQKVQHHVATAIGLCRRAAEVECLGAFKKNKTQEARTRTAADAVKFLWDYLGWTGSKRDCALGLFGRLHTEFRQYRQEALRLCRQLTLTLESAVATTAARAATPSPPRVRSGSSAGT